MGSNVHEQAATSANASLEDDPSQEYTNSANDCSEQKTILKQISPCISIQDTTQQGTYIIPE